MYKCLVHPVMDMLFSEMDMLCSEKDKLSSEMDMQKKKKKNCFSFSRSKFSQHMTNVTNGKCINTQFKWPQGKPDYTRLPWPNVKS